MPKTVGNLMTPKPVTVDSNATVQDAARLMREHHIGTVIVTENGKLAGLVTDRDIVVRGVAEHEDATKLKVSDVLTRDVTPLAPSDPVEKAVELMRKHAVRRFPVVEDGRPVGVLAIGDLAIDLDPTSVLAQISSAEPNN
jgi:CBS domain-containing protein